MGSAEKGEERKLSVHRRLARHGRRKNQRNMNMLAVSNNTPFYSSEMTVVGSTQSVQCSRYASARAYGRVSDAASNRFCVEIQMDPKNGFIPRKAHIFGNDFGNKDIEFNQDLTSGQWCFDFTPAEMTFGAPKFENCRLESQVPGRGISAELRTRI